MASINLKAMTLVDHGAGWDAFSNLVGHNFGSDRGAAWQQLQELFWVHFMKWHLDIPIGMADCHMDTPICGTDLRIRNRELGFIIFAIENGKEPSISTFNRVRSQWFHQVLLHLGSTILPLSF
jgi:hypothetical protein